MICFNVCMQAKAPPEQVIVYRQGAQSWSIGKIYQCVFQLKKAQVRLDSCIPYKLG